MPSLSLEKLVTCGVIRSFNYDIDDVVDDDDDDDDDDKPCAQVSE